MARNMSDGIVKAWDKMTEAKAAMSAACNKCLEAANAIEATKSEVAGEVADKYRERAKVIGEMLQQIEGKPKK